MNDRLRRIIRDKARRSRGRFGQFYELSTAVTEPWKIASCLGIAMEMRSVQATCEQKADIKATAIKSKVLDLQRLARISKGSDATGSSR